MLSPGSAPAIAAGTAGNIAPAVTVRAASRDSAPICDYSSLVLQPKKNKPVQDYVVIIYEEKRSPGTT